MALGQQSLLRGKVHLKGSHIGGWGWIRDSISPLTLSMVTGRPSSSNIFRALPTSVSRVVEAGWGIGRHAKLTPYFCNRGMRHHRLCERWSPREKIFPVFEGPERSLFAPEKADGADGRVLFSWITLALCYRAGSRCQRWLASWLLLPQDLSPALSGRTEPLARRLLSSCNPIVFSPCDDKGCWNV